MKLISKYLVLIFLLCGIAGCEKSIDLEATSKSTSPSAKEILGNPNYPAISYGGYREKTREQGPSVADLKEDMQILFAMGVRVLRTYNASQFPKRREFLKLLASSKRLILALKCM